MGVNNDVKNANEAVSYEEALGKAGHGKFQYIVVLIGGFIICSSYISVGVVSYILPAAQCDLNMDSEAKGRLASAGFIGLIIGCHMWGFLSDTLGRRYILIRCLLADGLLYLIISVTPYYSAILVFRLINGFVASGGVASIYAYVGEFCTDKYRTKAIMMSCMLATSAYYITPFYAWLTIPSKFTFEIYPGLEFKSWRIFYAVSGMPSLSSFLLIYFLPESPKFLLAKGRTDKSIEDLKRIHKFNGKNQNQEYTIKNIKINENEKVAKLGDDKNKVIAFFQLMWNQTVPLFKEPHRLNIALVCLAQYLAFFSNGGMYLWLPETFNRLANFRAESHNEYASFCDIVEYGRHSGQINVTENLLRGNFDNVLTTSTAASLTVLQTCTEDVDVITYFYLAVLGVIQTINLGVITAASKILNKKYLLIGLTICALLSSIAIQYVKVTDYTVYDSSLLIIFTGAIIPLLNSVVVELFPTNLCSMASCLTLMSCRLGSITTNIIAGMTIDHHCNEFIWCFIVAMAICLITIGIMPTKSKQKAEIKDLANI